jgi:tetratricopeptide (TPR) repeat protein
MTALGWLAGLVALTMIGPDIRPAGHGQTLDSDSSRAVPLVSRLQRARTGLYNVPADSSVASFTAIVLDARALRMRALQAEALVWLAEARNVAQGAIAAIATLDSAERILPGGADRVAAHLYCVRAYYLMRLGRPGVMATLTRGHAAARRAGAERERALCFLMEGAWQINVEEDEITAPPLLDSAEAIARRAGDAKGHASVQFWRGYDRFTLSRYGEARPIFRATVEEGRSSGNLRAAAWGHRYLYSIAVQHGDLVLAQEELARADSLFRLVGDREGLAQVQAVRGAAALAAGDWGAVERSATALLQVARETGLASLEQRARGSLLRAAIWQGQTERATRASAEMRIFLHARGLQAFATELAYGNGLIALAAGDLRAAESHFAEYLRTSSAGQHLQRYTAHARLAEVAARRGELDLAERLLGTALRDLDSLRGGLADLRPFAFQAETGWGDPDVGIAGTLAALVRGGRAEAAFAVAEHRRARVLAEQLGHTEALRAGEVAARLPPDGALLEFVTGRPRQPTVLFVVTARGTNGYVLPAIDSLAPDVRRFVALVEAGDDAEELSLRLGRTLLGAALAELPSGVTRLLIVPDDALHRLPFDALALRPGELVVDRFASSFAPSAEVALRLRDRPGNTGERVLAFADPQFTAETKPSLATETLRSAFEATGGLTRLAGSAKEAAIVASYAPHAEVRLRSDASEAFLRQRKNSPFRVVHFATHALVDERSTERSALALAPGSGEDGFVGVAELAGLRLRADLVVLSACRSAGGAVLRGEGVAGLTAPLLAGGARAVLATQWRIADRSTLRLVDGFYAALAQGLPADQALRQARLAVRAHGAPAREWAAFVLVGDPTVQVPLRQPSLTARMRTWWAMR